MHDIALSLRYKFINAVAVKRCPARIRHVVRYPWEQGGEPGLHASVSSEDDVEAVIRDAWARGHDSVFLYVEA